MPNAIERKIPNPASTLLANAIIGGVGLDGSPASEEPPAGMGMILLYVPTTHLVGKPIIDLQADLGLPWCVKNDTPIWFDEMPGLSG